MKDGFVKVAAGTPQLYLADCEKNLQAHIEMLQEAADQGVKLICFPELSLTGYTCGDLFLARPLLKAAENALSKLVAFTAGMDIVAVVGVPVSVNAKLYNCAAVINDGRILGLVPKVNLPNYGEFYDRRQFTPAPCENSTAVICGEEVPFGAKLLFGCRQMPELCIGVEICEDLWVPTPPSEMLARAGATIIANPSASDETIGKSAYRRKLVAMQSAKLLCGYIYANAGLGESSGDMVFSGHNLITENGAVLTESNLFDTGLIISEVDIDRLCHERRRQTTFMAPEWEEYERVDFDLEMTETAITRNIEPYPFVPRSRFARASRCEEILAIQAHGLARRMTHTHCASLVIGISGGLDSCLALLVAVKAADILSRPRTDIIAVTMPCFGTTRRTKSNAEILCKCLGVTFNEVNITDAVRCHFRDIGHSESEHNVVYENSQARERTQVLMDIANDMNGLVVGTGDLSELALGWATYNGDHMSMYGVNGSIPKTLVRHIVAYVADESEPELAAVLRDILDTPVSPELLPAQDGDIAQRTEDIVGPYDLHDFFLYYLVRFGFGPKKIFRMAQLAFEDQFGDEVILKWLRIFCRRFFNQQFKRSCLPDGPKVGSVSFSPRGDWRMPSDAFSAAWLTEVEELEAAFLAR